MAHGKLDYSVNRGASFTIGLTWFFPDDPDDAKSAFNSPQDLTGWTGEMSCSGALAGFPLLLTLGGINGTIDGQIDDTSSWPAGTYSYQLKMTAPDASIDIILVGKICVVYVPSF
jgi:hypothetical protein